MYKYGELFVEVAGCGQTFISRDNESSEVRGKVGQNLSPKLEQDRSFDTMRLLFLVGAKSA
jgi:hypothetical protein